MKKTIAFLAIAAAVAFVASVGMASAALPVTATLYAGQNISVGTVTVSNVSNNITIEYNITTDGWVMNETHLHVGDSLGDIPQTKKNNPIPGKFDYSAEHVPPVTMYTYTTISVPVSGELYIAAHAEVALLNETDYVLQEESAWAGIDVGEMAFDGKNWATYFMVTVDDNL